GNHTGNLSGAGGADDFNFNAGAVTGNIDGGADADIFDFNGGTVTGNVDGQAGSDTLDYAGATAGTGSVTLNAVGATDGFSGLAGGAGNITGTFDDIDVVVGSSGTDTLTGINADATWTVNGGGTTYTTTSGTARTLTFSAMENLTGNAGADTFNVTGAHTGNLLGGAGNDTFDIAATLTGSLDGEAGTDILQGTSITDVVLTGSDADGFAGTEADITLGFDGIRTITGNGAGTTLTGRNTASTWGLDGTPTYNDGAQTLNFTNFATLQGGTNTDAFNVTAASAFNLNGGAGVDTFDIDATLTGAIDGEAGADILQGTTITDVTLTGSDADGFAGTEADVTGNFDGIQVLTGTGGGTLTGRNVASTWGLDGTPTYSDGNTLNFTGFSTLQGGTNTDAFNVTAASAFTLNGGAGVDTFDIDATLTGPIDGEAGADILQGNLITDVTLTGSDADGFAGTEADVTGNFDGISVINGTNATLTGINDVSTFNLTGANSGTYVRTQTLTYSGVQNLNGGTNTDTFNIAGGSIAGALTGGAGTDTITGGTNYVVTGADAGTVTGITGGWSQVENLTGSAGGDTFTVNAGGTLSGLMDGAGGVDSSTFNPAITVTLNGTNTGITNIENVDMTGDGVLVGNAAGTSTWDLNLNGATGDVSDGTTTVRFTNTPTIRNGAGGRNTFNATAGPASNYNGTIQLSNNNNFWAFTPGSTLTTGTVTGAGALTIPGTGGADLTIGTAATDLILPDVSGFTGHLIIGGELGTNGPPGPPDNGNAPDNLVSAASIRVNVNTLDVASAIDTDGVLTLLAGDIDLNANIDAGGTVGMIAAGVIVNAGLTGNITAETPVTITAPDAALIAGDNIVNPTDITLTFGGGEIDIAKVNTDDIEFNGASTFTDTVTAAEFEAFVTSAGGSNIFTTPILANVNIVGLTITQAFSINPASALIGLETLAFIDIGLFEEELQLYGVIGTGIALALAQCEETEGCAPNVSEDELNSLIGSLEARLLELERRLAEESDENVRADLEELIEGFNEELNDFRGYRQDLQDFFSAEEEEEDFDDEDLGDEEEGLFDEETSAEEVDRLAKILETIQARIEWLESLKGQPEERERLGNIIGIELTQEALDSIIDAAKSEAAFIEKQIKLLIEGTEAMLDEVPASMFTAQARDYNSMQTVHYTNGLYSFGNLSTESLLNIY
ncbi:MAG: hypothetical protein AAF419_03480, partial [Pseudomonadota bacterium]